MATMRTRRDDDPYAELGSSALAAAQPTASPIVQAGAPSPSRAGGGFTGGGMPQNPGVMTSAPEQNPMQAWGGSASMPPQGGGGPAQPFFGGATGVSPTPSTPDPSAFSSSFFNQGGGGGIRTNGQEYVTPPNPNTIKQNPSGGEFDLAEQARKLQTVTDPREQAIAHDKLARDTFANLKSSGHDVKWGSGNQLMIDGRPYEFASGGGAPAQDGGGQTPVDPRESGGGLNPGPKDRSAWNTDGFAAPITTMQAGSGAPLGWDAGKWNDPNHQTPKYAVGRILSNFGPDQDGFNAAVAEIQKAYPGTTTDGKDKVTIPGVGTIDVRVGAEQGGKGWAWQPLDGASGGGGGVPGSSALAALMGPGGGVTSSVSSAASGVSPVTGAVGGGAPGAGPSVQGSVESLLQSILANPSTLDQRAVDTMKAASKDELANMAAGEDQQLQALANQMGIDGSPWLAAARSANANARDMGLAASNRNIDLTAAQTRNADRLAAAGLGTSYSGAQQNMANQQAIANLQAMTQRYGIDTSAMIDKLQLAQGDSQFAQNLNLQLQKMAQDDAQFGANYGLNAAQLQWMMNQYGMNQLG